jgi:hypothetical protein
MEEYLRGCPAGEEKMHLLPYSPAAFPAEPDAERKIEALPISASFHSVG